MLDFSLATQKKQMIDALCAIINIESVKGEAHNLMPYGKGNFDVLMKMLSIADNDLDFDGVNLFSHLGYVDYGDGDETLAILTHLDVVPAGEGWTVPPFECTVKDGKIYGRGAIDNKGPAIAALFALNAIKNNCVTLKKRVRLIFGCDEESGWSDIEFYKNSGGEIPAMAFSPDAEFPIINAEKGLMQFSLKKKKRDSAGGKGPVLLCIDGGTRVNVVPAHCECVIRVQAEPMKELVELFNQDSPVKIGCEAEGGNVRLTAAGVAAHGSKPENGKNAVAYMIAFLNTLPLVKNSLSDAVCQLAERVGLETDGKSLGIAGSDALGALTANLGYIRTTEGGVEAGLDVRYPVSGKGTNIMRSVLEKLDEFDVEVPFSQPAHFVPEDSVLVKGLKQAYEEVTGEAAVCKTMGGATYARAFPNAVAFGPLFPGQAGTEHNADEYIEIESLIKLADIIANAILILCT